MKNILLVDIGNSRLKWSLWNGRVRKSGKAVEHGGKPEQAIERLPLLDLSGAWIAHVTGRSHEAKLRRGVLRRFGIQPQFARSEKTRLDLRNAYREPSRLGVDRWLAMLGAWKKCPGPLCIADAGTALTVDQVNSAGHHLGGLIAPGLLTAERAVLGATRFQTRQSQVRYTTGLGRDTEACVRQGAYWACIGAIQQTAARNPSAKKFITGGDAPLLLKTLGSEWEHCPDLVLEGLLALALDCE